ncbi:hypothetical protein [Actinomadura fibrosa]|uniref:Uncharacterized protein n=1 Tax=Actinomadura fibrosa TaxID=111802 RepID=A0ABW2XIE1_9ACTN|nr:hypothetical protein [Actinomadura fibrosa]
MRPPAKAAAKLAAAVSMMSVLASAMAMAGGPAAAGLAAMLGVPLAALCWVLNDPGRSERLVQVIHAIRATTPPPPGDSDQHAISPASRSRSTA